MAGDVIVFMILSIITIVSSVLVMEVRDIFRAALLLALTFASLAGIFILLTAEFLAAIQLLVYAGAVVVLILFAIVLTRREKDLMETNVKNNALRTGLILLLVVLILQPIVSVPWPSKLIEFGQKNTYQIGFSLFTDYVIPFEIVSLALLAALIGAIYISKREVQQ